MVCTFQAEKCPFLAIFEKLILIFQKRPLEPIFGPKLAPEPNGMHFSAKNLRFLAEKWTLVSPLELANIIPPKSPKTKGECPYAFAILACRPGRSS